MSCFNEQHSTRWIHLRTGKEFSRLLYPNPVCFLSTTGECSPSKSSSPEHQSTIAQTNPCSIADRCNAKYIDRDVMVLSWLTPTNNQGRFMFSIHTKRYSASLLAPPILQIINDVSGKTNNLYTNNYNVGVEFALSVPVKGMEHLVLDVGSVSGRFGSKFPSIATSETTSTAHYDNEFTSMSNRQRKKAKKRHFSLHGIPGLTPVNLGHRRPPYSVSPMELVAIQGTVAHMHCRTYAVMGTSSMETNPSRETIEDCSAPIVDDDHLIIMAEVVNAFVHPSYWDSNKLLFRPRRTADNGEVNDGKAQPFLTFLGSQTFGYVDVDDVSTT
eukprot:scaffold1961_cov219-Alexandrium_tamarense.AAC.22